MLGDRLEEAMVDSTVEEVSEVSKQVHGRDLDTPVRGGGKKDKSCDAIIGLDGRV